MKRSLSFFILIFSIVLISRADAQRSVININNAWKFGSTSDQNVIKSDFNDSGWQTIKLPHSWNGFDGQDGGNNLYRGEKWYRKSILAESSWQGKKVFLKFGAANLKTDVYINGQLVGTHIGGYAAFIFDITKYLLFGQNNLVAVKVDNSSSIDAPPLSGDFSFFGGISRDVELIITDPIFISPLDYASPGVYITPHNISSVNADVNIQVLTANHSNEDKDVEVLAYINNRAGVTIDSVSTIVSVKADTTINALLDIEVESPTLWDAKNNPYLYSVVVKLRSGSLVTDQVVQPLGFRTYSVDDDTGFVLNDEPYSLHGVCHHEDRPDIGRALSNEQRKEDLDVLVKDLGCTYLRLVHYQHGEFTYDYCDSMGMVLSTEVPLVNKISSSSSFTANSKSQLNELIKQNYNHPSIFFWGMFNEINFHSGPNPASLINQLNSLSHNLDSTRLTTGAAQNDEADTHWLLDVCGWNKYMGWYDGSFEDYASWADWLRSAHPDTKIGMSEYGAGASINHHQDISIRPNPGGPFHPEEYQSDYHEAYYQAMLERPFIWSTAIWVAYDFASDYRNEGDAAGINDKGLITRDRKVKKDAYFYYKANWSSDPFVYITSRRFIERTSTDTKVKAYSNCDSVRLFVNDMAYNVQKSSNHIFKWPNVKLQEGENTIKVTGYSGNESFLDSCTWNCNPAGTEVLLPGDLQINFQTPNSSTPEGYLADAGDAYADRGNGYFYGWNADNTGNSRERSFTSDQVFNTFNHIIKNDVSYTWEIAVENGAYQVSIGCGDPDYTDSYHKIMVEGNLILEGLGTLTSMKVSTDTVTVLDGKLTVKSGVGASNPKINMIHLTKLDSVISSQLSIQNGSFEQPADDLKFRADGNSDGGEFNGNVPGWWADANATDCGRQNTGKPSYDGTYTGYAFNNDGGSIWAIAGTVEEQIRELTLSFNAWESYPKNQDGVFIAAIFAVYDGSDPANFTVIDTLKQPFDHAETDVNGWADFTFNYTLPASVVGKNLLIGYDVITESSSDSWFSFDNFNLEASPVTGIDSKVLKQESVMVYPNPAGNYITIHTHESIISNYRLYSITGSQVLSGTVVSLNETVDISSVEAGVYLLKIENTLGSQVLKVIIK